MSIFDPRHFADPSKEYRPLQIVHGMDAWLAERDLFGCGSGGAGSAPDDASSTEQDIGGRLAKLCELGIGGIVANVSFNDYLVSERQWRIFLAGMQAADRLGMILWLYDEKGYPSGTAGGLVTRANPGFAALSLACYPSRVEGPCTFRFDRPASCQACECAFALSDTPQGTVEPLDLSGLVDAQGTLAWDAPPGRWTVLYLARRLSYEGTHACNNVYEFKHYVNVLDKAAIAEFIRLTHAEYRRRMPDRLWAKVRAIFTDEPSFMTAYIGELPERFRGKIPVVDRPMFIDRPAAVPWHADLPERFRQLKGYDLLSRAHALFRGRDEQACAVRQDFYEVATDMYVAAFSQQITDWCRRNGIAFSGHFMAEETLGGHVAYQGSLLAVVRPMDLPGIDMLDSDPESMLKGRGFLTAKQVSSAAHLTGAKQVHSECSDWVQRNTGAGATLAQRRGQGNLLYALGINQVTAYWSWDDIGEDGYRAYNDYMGRLGSLLRGGRHVCDVAVLYPIRSAWAHHIPSSRPPTEGLPDETLAGTFSGIAADYEDLVRRLIRGQIDLDIIDEESIACSAIRDGSVCVADEAYRVIVLPTVTSLGVPVANVLAELCRTGGAVIGTSEPPTLAGSPASASALRELMRGLFGPGGTGKTVRREDLVAHLRRHHNPDLLLDEPNDRVVYTHRVLDGRDLYFVANNAPQAVTLRPRFRTPGPYTLYRPVTGGITQAGECRELTLDAYEGAFVVCPQPPG